MTEQLHTDVAATARVLAAIRVELAKKRASAEYEKRPALAMQAVSGRSDDVGVEPA